MENRFIGNAIEKLHKIADELKYLFLERNHVIDNSIKALITGHTVLLIGPPGTAKSALTHALCDRIENAKYFSWLLNRTSDPAEILGPFSIKEMENDKFLRVTKNKLPESEIAFLDEIFKCNEPTLNILLPLINEKLFFNDGTPSDVPLITLFAASNEFPDDESLDALYDRMMFRMEVKYINDQENKLQMLKGFLNSQDSNQIETKISMEDLALLRDELNQVLVPDAILLDYISLMNKLLQNGILISDRRQNECLKILRATALMDHRYEVIATDFEALQDVLWNEPEDKSIVNELLEEHMVSPLLKEYNRLKSRYHNLFSSSQNMNDTRLLIEVKSSIEYILSKTTRLILEHKDTDKDAIAKLNILEKELEHYLHNLTQTIGDDEEDLLYGIG